MSDAELIDGKAHAAGLPVLEGGRAVYKQMPAETALTPTIDEISFGIVCAAPPPSPS